MQLVMNGIFLRIKDSENPLNGLEIFIELIINRVHLIELGFV